MYTSSKKQSLCKINPSNMWVHEYKQIFHNERFSTRYVNTCSACICAYNMSRVQLQTWNSPRLWCGKPSSRILLHFVQGSTIPVFICISLYVHEHLFKFACAALACADCEFACPWHVQNRAHACVWHVCVWGMCWREVDRRHSRYVHRRMQGTHVFVCIYVYMYF